MCGKMQTWITPNTDTFYAVYFNVYNILIDEEMLQNFKQVKVFVVYKGQNF